MVIIKFLGMVFLLIIVYSVVAGRLTPTQDEPEDYEKDEKWRNGWRDYP